MRLIRKYLNQTLQTNQRHNEEETHNTYMSQEVEQWIYQQTIKVKQHNTHTQWEKKQTMRHKVGIITRTTLTWLLLAFVGVSIRTQTTQNQEGQLDRNP